MTDRRRAARADRDPSQEDNPFAAPPDGRPDRPWRPRRPERGEGGEGHGSDSQGKPEPEDAKDSGGSPSGSRWSSKQPGPHDGGFGGSRRPDQSGDGNGGRRTPGMRWDPTDPKQRHARYALHGGILGLFCALIGQIELALLLGAFSVYWGVSALRGPSSVRSTPTATANAEDVAGTDRTTPAGASPSGDPPPSGPERGTVSPAQA
ncbi:hypothetical protein N566_02625, partial [Streptomycetaceae bacterium MP113-05]